MNRSEVIRYVTRLIDYGKGHPDAEFDRLTIGQIADRIIDLSRQEEDHA